MKEAVQCAVCGGWHEDSHGAIKCFFRHQNEGEDMGVEKVCELAAGNRDPKDILKDAAGKYGVMVNALELLDSGGALDRDQLIKNLAGLVLVTTQICFIFTELDELNEEIGRQADILLKDNLTLGVTGEREKL